MMKEFVLKYWKYIVAIGGFIAIASIIFYLYKMSKVEEKQSGKT